MSAHPLELWDVWYPFAGATGVPFARGRLDPTDEMWIHSAPDAITIEVRADDGRLLARGQDLMRTSQAGMPMTHLQRIGDKIVRQDVWPDENAVGKTVLLPGGEVGIIKAWWHAPDHSEWRWLVEFYNHR